MIFMLLLNKPAYQTEFTGHPLIAPHVAYSRRLIVYDDLHFPV